MKRVTIYVDENDWNEVKDSAYINRVSCGNLLMDLYRGKYPKTKNQPKKKVKPVGYKPAGKQKRELTPQERLAEWKRTGGVG